MLNKRRIEIVDRRDVVVGGTAAAALALLFGSTVRAQAPPKPLPSGIDEAIKKILGDAKPAVGKIMIELPEIAENGNTVPFTLSVESPMTEASHVKAIHVLAGGNPQPGVGSFFFTPASGKAAVSSRMRLARTQDVTAIVELSDGRFLLGRRTVKVTIGGCGG